MSKECKVLYIIGIVFSTLLLVLSILLTLSEYVDQLDGLYRIYDKLNVFGFTSTNYYLNTIICLANIVLILLILLLKKYDKGMTISILVLSALSSNIFGIIGSIISLVQNKKKVENARVFIDENNERIVFVEKTPRVRRERKPIRRLELKSSDLALSIIGMVFGILLIFVYLFMILYNIDDVVDFFNLGMSKETAFYLFIFVMIYALFVAVIVLIPVFLIIVSIAFTIILISTRRRFFAKLLSILGFISLTIFNGIAAVKMLNRFEEDNKKDLIA